VRKDEKEEEKKTKKKSENKDRGVPLRDLPYPHAP